MDFVELKGSDVPYSLYTIDLNVKNLVENFKEPIIKKIPKVEID